MELNQKAVMEILFNNITSSMEKCGFAPEYQDGRKNGCPAYERGDATVMDYSGDKGVARLVFSNDRIHLLFASKDAPREDDSAFTKDTTYLFILDEYNEKDAKGIANEINEYITEIYIDKKKAPVKTKDINTVSRTAARRGISSYDPVTLATKLAAIYPELKEEITANIALYGEFLCEEFFVTHANKYIQETIREGNPQKMKRLFNILGEVYEDGTNEVQSLIAVTILGFVENDPVLIQKLMPYFTDTMLEPVLAVSKRLKKSKSARLRLENPPKFKPKKQKKSKGLMNQLLGAGLPQQ